MRKVLSGFILAVSLMVSGAVSSHSADIPHEITEWSETNVWLVKTSQGSGSAFFLTPDLAITACHVVDSGQHNLDDELMVFGVNNLTTEVLQFRVEHCNKDTDIAVLTVHEFSERPKNVAVTRLEMKVPDQGTAVWGTGYPLGGDLVITQGHLQRPVELNIEGRMGYIITANTIMGDSGSPVVRVVDGEVQVVGLRLAIKGVPMFIGFARFNSYLPHLTLMGTAFNIHKAITDAAQG